MGTGPSTIVTIIFKIHIVNNGSNDILQGRRQDTMQKTINNPRGGQYLYTSKQNGG